VIQGRIAPSEIERMSLERLTFYYKQLETWGRG
jgi:hypothetical protein